MEIADLERQSKLLLAAIHENTIVLATRDRIFFADSSGELNGALAGTFVPYTMSLDEMGRIYLILSPKSPIGHSHYGCCPRMGNSSAIIHFRKGIRSSIHPSSDTTTASICWLAKRSLPSLLTEIRAGLDQQDANSAERS